MIYNDLHPGAMILQPQTFLQDHTGSLNHRVRMTDGYVLSCCFPTELYATVSSLPITLLHQMFLSPPTFYPPFLLPFLFEV